jgi:ribosomal protein S27AE
MAFEETQKFCPSCGRNVLARRKGTNHILHFLITFLTCGIWLLFWAGSSVKFGGWLCSQCGSNALQGPK